MHFAISTTWGPTDPTRAMLPFLFAASAVQAGDRVTLMLFHDAVLMAVEGAGAKLVPVGPPNRYEEIAGHANVTLWACKPCVEVRSITMFAPAQNTRSSEPVITQQRTSGCSKRRRITASASSTSTAMS